MPHVEMAMFMQEWKNVMMGIMIIKTPAGTTAL